MEKISIRQSNKGFTLVEIVVTIVIFTFLATVATLGLVNWRQYSLHRNQTDNAELLYMAARNKIAQLKANNVLDEFNGWGNKASDSDNYIIGVDFGYKDMETNTSVSSLYYALCSKGDYVKYCSNDNISESAKLIFELTSDYISDKGILNGNIVIEYGQDGTIYGVFYSDRTEMSHGSTPKSNTLFMNNLVNRDDGLLYDKMVGVYKSQ